MATIEAKRRLNRTPFRLEKGKRYRFSASGTWKDWTHECSATGYTTEKLRRWEGWRRERSAKWFSVIGCIDKIRDTQFDIGRLIETNSVYTASATGVLYCFANDVWFMYWNNEDSIDLQVEPLEGKQIEAVIGEKGPGSVNGNDGREHAMKHKVTVHYLSVVGPPAVCALAGALLGWWFGNPVTGAVTGLAAGATVAVLYLILTSTGRVYVETVEPDLSEPDAEPRNHVICIDGTWNHPEVPTNVRRFYDYVDVDGKVDGKQPIARYYSGVGARENKGVALRVLKKNYSKLLFGGATGYGTEAILRQAYFDFVQQYRRGDRLFIVGFSRGAATARMLANMISSTAGLPASVEIEYLKLVIEKDVVIGLNPMVPRKWGVPEVELLGVWDTVAAFGNPWNRVDLFKDLTLAPGIRKAYHLVAIDERRKTFDVTLLDPDERVEQIWFAGAHANVGGGLEKENSALSDIALRFMINRASEHGLRFKKEAFDIRGDAGGTMWQAGRFWKWKIERKLGGDARQLPRIHKSVFQRMQLVSNYEPANVKELGDAFQRDERD